MIHRHTENFDPDYNVIKYVQRVGGMCDHKDECVAISVT